jgi:hypothetical protein
VVALGAFLVVTVRAPERPVGEHAVRGHRVFRVARHAVRALDVTLGERRFSARRAGAGWELDGRPAPPRAAEALDDLLDTLATLRAVDVFRRRDVASYGLDRPQATFALHTARRTRRVVVGGLNAAASALYAERAGDPRVLLVGTLILTEAERVFYAARTVSSVP